MPPRYRGWSEKDVRLSTAQEDDQLLHGHSEENDSLPSYQTTSFTPINCGIHPKSTEKPQTRGKDSDTLYDIPPDDGPFPAPSLGQKRKRRATTLARNKSVLATPIKQARHNEEDSPLSKQFPYLSVLEKQTSTLLPTPPDPKKRTTRISKPALPKQVKAFPKTSIIKPNVHQSYGDSTFIKPSTEYTISTPSSLDKITKIGHNGLGKTTLEKLVAFRFKETSVDVTLGQCSSQNIISAATLNAFSPASGPNVTNGGIEPYAIDLNQNYQAVIGEGVQRHTADQPPLVEQAFEGPEEPFDDLFHELEVGNISCLADTLTEDSGHSYGDIGKNTPMQVFTEDVKGNVATNTCLDMQTELQNTPNLIEDPLQSSGGWDEGLDDYDFAQLDTGDITLLDGVGTQHNGLKNAPTEYGIEPSSDDFDDGVAGEDFMEIMGTGVDINHNLLGIQEAPVDTEGQQSAGIEDILPGPLSIQVIDDEYPMDDDDEAELANLAELTGPLIVESHSPPSNWLPSDCASRDREVYDEKLEHSPISSRSMHEGHDSWMGDSIINKSQLRAQLNVESLTEPEDWSFLSQTPLPSGRRENSRHDIPAITLPTVSGPSRPRSVTDDSNEYFPLPPFARPPFPVRVRDRSPVTGITSTIVLRTCFRVGEALRAGSLCSRLNQDAVIELFARVTFSSREDGTHKQHFQFADLFHSNPPFITGVLENYHVSALQETESKALLTRVDGKPEMVRCLGRLKRQVKGNGWVMHICNIRKTDWEEVRWTKKIVGAGEVKQELE